ncbi:putative Natriuretic peptide Na-NP protein [Naja naja]|nr:putative Natriuretic peptide Na-NP protein [Naja naja]
MVGLSRLAGGGLVLVLVLALTLLPLATMGKPAPPPQPLHKPPPPVPAALRIIRDLRPNSKQSRATRDQVVHPESHAGGGSGRDSRPLQHRVKKGPPSGCFGLKLDRIGTMSGLGCNGGRKPIPTPKPCGRL